MKHASFDEDSVLHELKHYLPTQTPLKDFIHHNSLHTFQDQKFYDAIFKASKIFGFQVTLELKDFRRLYQTGRISDDMLNRAIAQHKGELELKDWKIKLLEKAYNEANTAKVGCLRAYWKDVYRIDIDNHTQPLLFRILAGYLDQGVSTWRFPMEKDGLLASVRALHENSFVGFFKTERAKRLLFDKHLHIADLLKIIVGKEDFFEQYLFDQQFAHRGWSGMVSTIEDIPDTLLSPRTISLKDAVLLELLLEIDTLDYHLGKGWLPLANAVNVQPLDLFENESLSELEVIYMMWQDAFEWTYYDEVLTGVQTASSIPISNKSNLSFQAMLCIDERECSLRRYLEQEDAHCETFGTPGFFGVEFYFQPQNGKFYDKLCPAPVTPKYLIKEYDVKEEREHELLYTEKTSNYFFGYFISLTLGFWAGIKLFLNILRPKMSPAISNAFLHTAKSGKLTVENTSPLAIENGLQVGFTVEEMTVRVEGLLRGIGLIKDFAPIVYVVAHGSSSANNPHHGAHDCGACSGRPGSVNARVAAQMANHPQVRRNLLEKGICIPMETQFVGSLHDTAADEIEFYDEAVLSEKNIALHRDYKIIFEKALDYNAKERSRRFASINTKSSLRHTRKAIKDRSVSLFEPRPELGHGTNSICVVGRRTLTQNLFLDRRAFLNSYDYRTDLKGELLTGVMRPLGPVCGGINLEYYFSRVDNHKLGAGTKLPHHVVGLIGVTNSCDGDLRPGLPLQMIEVHDPVRLLIIVEHFPEVVLSCIQSSPQMYEWYINEWVHLVVINPETNELYRFDKGEFVLYYTGKKTLPKVDHLKELIESAKEMKTNYIVDATTENLSVYALK